VGALKDYSKNCGTLRIRAKDKLKYHRLMLRCGAKFNTSSMALRAGTMRDIGDKLRQHYLLDLLFFYASMMNEYDLFLTSERLTRYRVSNITKYCHDPAGPRKLKDRALYAYSGAAALKEYLKGTPFYGDAIIDFDIYFNSILSGLLNDIVENKPQKLAISPLLGFVKSCIRTGKYKSLAWAFIAISPRILRRRLTNWALCGSMRVWEVVVSKIDRAEEYA
jgi:hypothetical protein